MQAQNYSSHNPVYELNAKSGRAGNCYKYFFLLHSGNMSHLLLGRFYPQDGTSVCMVSTSCNIQLENHNMVNFFFILYQICFSTF